MGIETGDLRESLLHATQQVLEGNWQVAAAADSGQASFAVALRSDSATKPDVSTSAANLYVGAPIRFTGGLNNGFHSTVKSVATASGTTTATLVDTLPNAVAAGDTFSVYVVPPGIPANVSQVTAAYSVGTSVTAIGSNPAGRKWILVFNNGTDAVYVGGSAVTTANGIPVPAGGSASFPVGPGISLYAISASASQDVRTMEAS